MRILFVDDMNERWDHFANTIAKADDKIAWAPDSGVAVHCLGEAVFDAVFLDHDLASEHYNRACSANSGCGCDIVDWICENKDRFQNTKFIVHSWNTEAAIRMETALRNSGLSVLRKAFS